MTNNNHPITPPDDLQEQWKQEWLRVRPAMTPCIQWMLAKSARWGYEQRGADIEDDLQKARDEELEACCEHLKRLMSPRATIDYLHAARRPKPPSLKEQAKFAAAVLRSPDETCSIAELQQHWHTICNALEQLND